MKQKTVRGLLWSSIERFSTQGVQFILGLILARLLLPSDYGLIGMLAFFIAISETFIQSGFGTALVQKKNRDNLDYSTTFYFNIVVALLFYALLFFMAPLISNFYNEPKLILLTRVIGLIVIINALAIVQRTKFTVNVDFKTQTKASLAAIITSGAVGIALAYLGFGVWALVIQTLLRRSIDTIILWNISKWRPIYGFSMERFKQLFNFGYKLLLSGLLDSVFSNIYTLIIGRVFSATSLGYYSRAKQFAVFPSANITFIIGRVTFPVLSEIQDEYTKLKQSYTRLIKSTALLIFPLMMGLAALAKPIILLILTDKWSDSIWMLQIMCFGFMLYPIHSLNLNVINVKGRSDWFLKLEIIKKVMIVAILAITIPMGLKALLIGQAVSSYLSLIINLHYTKRVIDYGFWSQIKDLFPIFLISILMGGVVYFISQLFDCTILQIVLGTFSGIVFYVTIVLSLNIGDSNSLKKSAINYLKQRKP